VAEVIGLPSVARLRELETENAKLREELGSAKVLAAKADGIYAVTRFQLNDLLATITAWRKTLDQIEENVTTLKLKLPWE
jgi:chlorite dismutase